MRAPLFDYKQPSGLMLNSRSNQDRAGLSQRLHSRRDVGDVTVDLACRIQYRRTGFQTDAGQQFRLA